MSATTPSTAVDASWPGASHAAMEQGSSSKAVSAHLLPPRSKPRQSSSPASSDGLASIGRSGIKGGRTPPLAGLVPAGSGGKFSFGKACMLSRGKSSPPLHGSACRAGSTPNLILGVAKQHLQHAGEHAKGAAGPAAHAGPSDDTAHAKDTGCMAAPAACVDLDLLQHATAEAINATVLALTEPQRQSVQRLVCNPRALAASPASLAVLAQCPALSFLILSLEGYDAPAAAGTGAWAAQAAGPQAEGGVDLWPELQRLMTSLRHVVCLDGSNCLLQDKHLQIIAQSCRGLRALDLSYSPHVTAAGLGALVEACSNLEELDVSTCPAATSDQLLLALGRCCPNLSSLYIELDASHPVSAAAVTATGAGPAAALEGCMVSSQGLAELARGCKQLQVLSLAGLPVKPSPPPISAATCGLLALAASCPALASLDLTGCAWPMASEWLALAGSGHAAGLPSLQTLSLSGTPTFDDEALAGTTAACSALTNLSLHGCCECITDGGLLSAVSALPHLATLTLPGAAGAELAAALGARGVRVVASGQGQQQQQQGEGEEQDEGDGQDVEVGLHAMELDQDSAGAAAYSPAVQGRGKGEGEEGGSMGPEPMSVARPADLRSPGGARARGGAGGAAGEADAAAGGQPSWRGLMSFLSSQTTSELNVPSCQKARKEQRRTDGRQE